MRVFSGIRPTGQIHIGNYFGAIKQWLKLQETKECLFCIVDLHAITTPYDAQKLKENILELAIDYLALGLDPKKSIIFVQSDVKEHLELAWIFGTLTPLGELKRMTQFKEKAKKYGALVNAGILNYPLLMAADILLYKADLVPVGKDQQQHVELTREIARRFNKKYGQTFKLPSAMLPEFGEKIMSLRDPTKKMSKTDDPMGCLSVFEEPEIIKEKIKKAVTDPGNEIKYDPKKKPGISNLIQIFSLATEKKKEEIEKEFEGKGYYLFKEKLAQVLIKKFEKFREKRKKLWQNPSLVQEILKKGKKRAEILAKETMQEVRKKIGLLT